MIFHITSEEQWIAAVDASSYSPDSLRLEGFIHCSTLKQLIPTANKYFSGQNKLVVLCINEAAVNQPIKYEDSFGSGQVFPHIYGELNLDAVERVYPLFVHPDGTFEMGSQFSAWLHSNGRHDEAKISTS